MHPFGAADGTPFQEVHHTRRLADGGPDAFTVKGGAKPRRVAGRSKSAAPLEELCETGRDWPMALEAVGRPWGLMEDGECTRTWTSG